MKSSAKIANSKIDVRRNSSSPSSSFQPMNVLTSTDFLTPRNSVDVVRLTSVRSANTALSRWVLNVHRSYEQYAEPIYPFNFVTSCAMTAILQVFYGSPYF